jgi:hypothetical protein
MSGKLINLDNDLWTTFGELAPQVENHGGKIGQTGGRSAVLRQFIRWYTGEPGVSCPRRPRSSVQRSAAGAADTEAFRAELKKAAGG